MDTKATQKYVSKFGDGRLIKPVRFEHVMNIIPVCTEPEFSGPRPQASIYIDNKGFWDEGKPCRLHPEFRVANGPHDWLNKSIFVGNLVDVPKEKTLITPATKDQNERLVQVFRLV